MIFIALLQITQVIHSTYDPITKLNHEQIKITNVSPDYIHNLKLIIDDSEHSLVTQLIKRERGALSFEPPLNCLELGNLAPEESAYFEYTYKEIPESASFISHLSLTYGNESDNVTHQKKVVEFLSNSTTP